MTVVVSDRKPLPAVSGPLTILGVQVAGCVFPDIFDARVQRIGPFFNGLSGSGGCEAAGGSRELNSGNALVCRRSRRRRLCVELLCPRCGRLFCRL